MGQLQCAVIQLEWKIALHTEISLIQLLCLLITQNYPDSKVHGANMGPIWGRFDPGGPHVGPMNFAIWVHTNIYPGKFCDRIQKQGFINMLHTNENTKPYMQYMNPWINAPLLIGVSAGTIYILGIYHSSWD